ncbi:S41 family peptidase [Cytophaga hutchinsonii]|uniref:C-terminal processing peptidase-1, Serine peptidase, MEROPS family S41A n=1 Tax=Cytophaga hutchinsonii (strain ATCC 33406 / DSM 1761 / CIP 103989 / NBRC 15051 / NCIMB 9469 / D465) TaxID=269798 RepID=A0A6N4SNR1_CYTH3|nr:S41 family peptidase [Cytophaga hutchinsonii]ABG57919.1 C-terminal processing peptidase-1, Serine peptidase, MEROPS family S41A [Cytophaga hutchinsonii ATCC 33406]SFX09018.1 C-terminal processing peptidase-1. Serine peptidase. MEROPS family S41A [Cytophaga hutchinsonii ATCC 33406]
MIGFILSRIQLIVLLLLTFVAIPASAQTSKTEQPSCSKKTDALWVLLTKKHIAPIQFNHTVSVEIADLLLTELDYKKIHFYESDRQNLLIQIQNLKPSSAKDLCTLIAGISELYQTRIKESQAILQTLAANELNFSENEIVTFSSSKRQFMESKEKKISRWKRNIKFLVLNNLYYAVDSAHSTDVAAPSNFLADKNKITRTIIDKELKKINALADPSTDFTATVENALLNAICKRFDPHTEYYNYTAFKEFSEHLQSKVLTFGVFFGETAFGNLSIRYVAPGSTAWFSNVIQENDVVLWFKLNQQVFDVSALTHTEANALLQNEKYSLLEIGLKKDNGSSETIKLKREAIKFENNTVKSYIIKDAKKIGYISIPSFYSDDSNPNALGAANELSKEILKLKNENIEGLIIDLRNNGGGSLYEAVGMSGLFIDIGPLFYVLERSGKATLTKDMNRGTVYDGPLCIMVNGYSASASEIFSAAMQDNHRALIVGEQTYGKATGQSISQLDTTKSISTFSATDNMGATKITEIKLYRTSGFSYQGKGVTPDIILPYLDVLSEKENTEPFYLKGDSIAKKAVFAFPEALPVASLNEMNNIRIKENPQYKQLKHVSDSLHTTQDDDIIIHLTAAGFWKDMRILKAENEKESAAGSFVRPGFEVYYNRLESDFLSYDANYKKLYTGYLDELKTDLILQQTHDIMCDFIKLKQK